MGGQGPGPANDPPVEARGRKAAQEKRDADADPEVLSELPTFIPENKWLVHNNAQPVNPLGTNGFEAWLQKPNPANLQACNCGWAPALGQHYREIWSTSPQAAEVQAEVQRQAEANSLPM
jgi:hypothetical protein